MPKKKTYYDHLRQELGELVEQLQLPDLYRQSLKQRWLDQVVWADKKAAECRRLHYRLRLATIVGGVILPALVGINFQIGEDNPALKKWFPYLPFALSQVIAVSATIEEFCRFGDRWRDYRKMSEDLKAEGWQYLQSSGAYEHDPTHIAGYPVFASRVESIIKNDVQSYITQLVKQQETQQQQIAQYVESAKAVAEDKTLFARPEPAPVVAANSISELALVSSAPSAIGTMQVRQDTVFKFNNQSSETLPDTQKMIIVAGSTFDLQAYQDGGNNHLYITLTQGIGAAQQNIWYVYAPHVELVSSSGQLATAAAPTPGAVGTVRVRQNTVFKVNNQASEALPNHQKIAVAAGSMFGLQAYQDGGNNHLYLTLTQGIGGTQQNIWYAYAPHLEVIDRQGQAITTIAPAETKIAPTAISTLTVSPGTMAPALQKIVQKTSIQLQVPYLSQRDNDNNPDGSCNVTSIAMCLKYLKTPQKSSSQQFEDELYLYMETNGLKRHYGEDLAQVVEAYSGQDRFTRNATINEVKQWLAQGNPCVMHGYFTSFGHIVCVTGYNEQGLIVHDPYGKWLGNTGEYDRNDSSNSEKGKAMTYSYESIERSCMTDNQFWVHFISKPGSTPPTPATVQVYATPMSSAPTLINQAQLIEICGHTPQDFLQKLVPGLNQALNKYQINKPLRIAHFIAQVAHESGAFQYMEEIADGADYEGREDLGNTQPGDGMRFKGRGLIQLTGRSNYESFSKSMSIDFVTNPKQVAELPYAILCAAWFWDTNKLNPIADQDDIKGITLTINGGLNGFEDRKHYLQAAKRVLGC